jgi:hypothetical protein
VEGGRCRGVTARTPAGETVEVRAWHTLLATGGAGQVFFVTTNPGEATGDGIAMAHRAGAVLADIEFIQFHPTALHHPQMPKPLLSEALRGHGALLRDLTGERFVDELLPRDQVSRAMTAKMIEQGTDHCWLDATVLENFDERFPTIARSLAEVGLDPAKDWLPIAPAAHYTCGGMVTDLDGASSVPASGARVRSPAPASTAPTAWPATPCWRAWCSALGWWRPSSAARTGRSPPGPCARSSAPTPPASSRATGSRTPNPSNPTWRTSTTPRPLGLTSSGR